MTDTQLNRDLPQAAARPAERVGVDSLVESVTHGVLRALDARGQGANLTNTIDRSLTHSSYLFTEIIIRAGGRPFAELLNQPAPINTGGLNTGPLGIGERQG